jgi:ankyrin repeat protein
MACLNNNFMVWFKKKSLLEPSESGDTEQVERLLEKGAEVDVRDQDGATALHGATLRRNLKMVKLLLHYGADVNAGNNAGYTALMVACKEGFPDVVRLLLKHGAKVNIAAKTGHTALLCAVSFEPVDLHSTLEVINLLLDHGANVNAKGLKKTTPLMNAAWFGLKEAVELLLRRGAALNESDETGRTALSMAQEKQHQEISDFLIGARAV